jgi:hypothetical protein
MFHHYRTWGVRALGHERSRAPKARLCEIFKDSKTK